MPVQLNHTIALATDPEASAALLSEMLGLGTPRRWGPFHEVQLDNGVTIDFLDSGGQPILGIHYAFLVTEAEFDEIFGRIKDRGTDYYADPHKQQPGEINTNDGGRGVYWDAPRRALSRDPDGPLRRLARLSARDERDVVSEATEPSRFFDAATGGTMVLQLEPDGARFRILRPFGYRDPAYDEPFVVPKDVATFRTDLASIPWFFAWLVPGLGTHLPAVLLHDGLVVGPTEGKTHIGPDVDREEADRILRDAMASLGTPVVRRWLMWTAVILATAFSTLRPRWRWAPLVVGTLAAGRRPRGRGDARPARRRRRRAVDGRPTLVRGGGARWALRHPRAAAGVGAVGPALAGGRHRRRRAGAAPPRHGGRRDVYGIYWVLERVVSAPEGASPSAKANLEEADTSEGRYLPAE